MKKVVVLVVIALFLNFYSSYANDRCGFLRVIVDSLKECARASIWYGYDCKDFARNTRHKVMTDSFRYP